MSLKSQLHQQSLDVAQKRMLSLKEEMQEAQKAANSETKSTAGDKYETGRAMAQLETERLVTQLTEAQRLVQVLSRLDPEKIYNQVEVGSLVITTQGNFYISVALGPMAVDGTTFFVISPVSPIGSLLLNKKVGEEASFKGKTYTIESLK